MKIKKAIYSGTFDPITNGHMDIIKRGLKVYDEIIIGVADSNMKQPMFNINSRISLIQDAVKDLKGVTVKSFDTLLVEFARKENVYNIIRGLRTNTDFEYELQMSYANSSLDKDIDTIFLMPCLRNAFVSSSIVRELIRFNADFSHLVPKNIIENLNKKVKEECM
ncbi:MAG: pantetheine-phosphate adenylyltransferase [Campylobacterota bacterium]|nr:pantetheine-phosphate adenylyltransferase [Campylobacterota bacterium]